MELDNQYKNIVAERMARVARCEEVTLEPGTAFCRRREVRRLRRLRQLGNHLAQAKEIYTALREGFDLRARWEPLLARMERSPFRPAS